METSYITAPIIGALIGYSTNWIAIKMMFRPRKAIRLGKITLPFTPGIIPRNRENLAYAISSTITKNLLTIDDINNVLLSDKIKTSIYNIIESKFNENKEIKINTILEENIGRQNLNNVCDLLLDKGSKSIITYIEENKLEKVIVEQIRKAIQKKIEGTILSIIGAKKIIDSVSKNIEQNLSEFIEHSGEKIIYEMIEKELNRCLELKIKEIDIKLDFYSVFNNIYEKFIENNLEEILKKINIEKIIQDKINSMDMAELEKIILKVMKTELNAVINLGALIGFILGLLNIIF